MRLSLARVAVALAVFGVLCGMVLGLISGAFEGVARRGLEVTGLDRGRSPGPSSAVPSASWESPGTAAGASSAVSSPSPSPASPSPSDPTGSPSPGPGPGSAASLLPVLPPAGAGPTAMASLVAKAIAGVEHAGVGATFSGEVVDATSGTVLYRHRASTGYIPASTTKLLTATAALRLAGPDFRFSTRVVRAAGDRIILVGGGDPTLGSTKLPGHASITALARSTAAALRADQRRSVRLGYDATRYTGPSWHPSWPAAYSDQVSKVSALTVNEGRVHGSPGPRVANPARSAAEAFAKALRKQKIAVTSVTAARAPADALDLAAVYSPPLERIVEAMMMASDNDAAEMLLREVGGWAGESRSFAGGVRGVHATLTGLGVWDDDTTVVDGSGLSRRTRVPATDLVAVLRLAVSPAHPGLRAVATGLPVAGVEGSLRVRFFDDQSLRGRGVVRAKTGTLRKVHSLAGYLRSADGTTVIYAFIVNNPKNDFNAVVWLDRVTTVLSRCGCRG